MDLSTPIRVHWNARADINTAKPANGVKKTFIAVAEKLTREKIFYLSISGWEDVSHKVLRKMLLDLDKSGILVSLILSGGKIPPADELLLCASHVKEFIFEISSEKDLLRFSPLQKILKKTPAKTSVSIYLHQENYGRIPSIIGYCAKNGIQNIIIPAPGIADKPKIPARDHFLREKIARAINGSPFSRNGTLNFIVHDPFLWKLLDPRCFEGRKNNFKGCQAANSTAYVDFKGDAYPCALLPIKLGNLLQNSFGEIWSSKERKVIRKKIEDVPENCKKCSRLSECNGGCRGLSLLINGDIRSKDPTCPVVRL